MQSFNDLKKNLKKDFSGFRTVKLAILSDSASQLLHQALKAYGYEAQVNFDIYEADYDQIDLQVFDQGSELYLFKPDFIFINRSTEHLLSEFYKKDRNEQGRFYESVLHAFNEYNETITSRLRSKIIFNTFPEIDDAVFGNFASKINSSFIYQLRKINLLLMELSGQFKSLFLCDIAALQSRLGYHFTFDAKMYINAAMVYSIDFLPYIAKHVTDIVQAVDGVFKKCLVLDLDNTLWGGIIGDDGIEGIQIGELGMGKAFTELQYWIKQLKERGIILAVCSKNTDEIAREPFEKHPDMILKIDDIAVFVANWETKVDNIRYIQKVLNIGLDSMVFIDDNPFEREMVKAAIPALAVPDLPEDPAGYLIYLRSLNLFETASFTDEDELRTSQYKAEAQRTIVQQAFHNETDFLASLEMEADVKPFNDFIIPRVAQLTQRSNQFNLRTVRYTEDEIKAISVSDRFYTLSLSLKDKFGDHGLVGLIILKNLDAGSVFIDSWIMSCRVLKRGMEQFTMNIIVDLARANNIEQITAEYIPTKKNGIVKDHYKDLGFTLSEDKWILNVAGYKTHQTFISNKQPIWN